MIFAKHETRKKYFHVSRKFCELCKFRTSKISCFAEVIIFAKLAKRGNFREHSSIFAIFVIFCFILKQAYPTVVKYVYIQIENNSWYSDEIVTTRVDRSKGP